MITRTSWPPEYSRQLDDQNDDNHGFEDKGARLVEFVDHEFVELAGGAQLLFHQVAVVVDSDASCRQAISPRVEHVAEELDRVVDALGELGNLEADLI